MKYFNMISNTFLVCWQWRASKILEQSMQKGGVANDSKLPTLIYSNLQSCQNTNKHMGVISPNDVMLKRCDDIVSHFLKILCFITFPVSRGEYVPKRTPRGVGHW